MMVAFHNSAVACQGPTYARLTMRFDNHSDNSCCVQKTKQNKKNVRVV
jgi:hypothetical protein